MPISVTCPACGKAGRLADGSSGRKVRCPACGTPFGVEPPAQPLAATAPGPPVPEPPGLVDLGSPIAPAEVPSPGPVRGDAGDAQEVIRRLRRELIVTRWLALAALVLAVALPLAAWAKRREPDAPASPAAPADPVLRLDPAYLPANNDRAVLMIPDSPDAAVPYYLDLGAYAAVMEAREQARAGQIVRVGPEHLAQMRRAPAGTAVRVLMVIDQRSIDQQTGMGLHMDCPYPWVKVVRTDAAGRDELNHELIGFTEPANVARLLPAP